MFYKNTGLSWFSGQLIEYYDQLIQQKNTEIGNLNNHIVNLTNEDNKLKLEHDQTNWYYLNYEPLKNSVIELKRNSSELAQKIKMFTMSIEMWQRSVTRWQNHLQQRNSELNAARESELENSRLYNQERLENESLLIQIQTVKQEIRGVRTSSTLESENGRRGLEEINQIIATLRTEILQIRERHADKILEIQDKHVLKMETEREKARRIEVELEQSKLNPNASDRSSETNPLNSEEENF